MHLPPLPFLHAILGALKLPEAHGIVSLVFTDPRMYSLNAKFFGEFIFSTLDTLLCSVELVKLSYITSHFLITLNCHWCFKIFDLIHLSCHVSRLELTMTMSLNLSILELASSAPPK